jgi:hypothetical protein
LLEQREKIAGPEFVNFEFPWGKQWASAKRRWKLCGIKAPNGNAARWKLQA